MNTDSVLMYKDSPILTKFPVRINEGKLYSERVLASLYGENLIFSAVNTEFKLLNNILKFQNLTADMYNGKLAGSLDFNLRDENYDSKKRLSRG